MRFSHSERHGSNVFTTHYDNADEMATSFFVGFMFKLIAVVAILIGLGVGLPLLFNSVVPEPANRIQVMTVITVFVLVGVWFNFYKTGLRRILTGILSTAIALFSALMILSYSSEMDKIAQHVEGFGSQHAVDSTFVIWLVSVGLIALMTSFTSPFILAWAILTGIFWFVVDVVQNFTSNKESKENTEVTR